MKKKLISLLAIMMLLTAGATAQIFMVEDGNSGNRTKYDPANDMPIPELGWTADQGYDPTDPDHPEPGPYAPLGGGAALLVGFGAAYLMARKGKRQLPD